MLKKLIVSFLCAIVVACTVLGGFCLLYFTIPSQKAKASISLPSTVEDSETAAESTTEEDSKDKNVYVADVYQSLTLRSEASADSDAITDLLPMTHLEVLEFAAGTNYAYVKVLTGDKESYKGYVNSEYITKLGEPTVRIGTEE